MAKSEMKFIGVVILMMIIVGSTQADNNSPDLTGCEVKCGFKCIAYFYSKKKFDECCLPCIRKCHHEMSIDVVYDCITGCRLTKSIDDNIGIYPFAKLLLSFIFIIKLIMFSHVFLLLTLHVRCSCSYRPCNGFLCARVQEQVRVCCKNAQKKILVGEIICIHVCNK